MEPIIEEIAIFYKIYEFHTQSGPVWSHGSGAEHFVRWGNFKPSPGYAGVSLSLTKTELNAHGLHRTDSLRLNPFFLNFFLGGVIFLLVGM